MNQTFLVPANSKRSALIFGFFKPVDLIIFGVGTGLSLILLLPNKFLGVCVDIFIKDYPAIDSKITS